MTSEKKVKSPAFKAKLGTMNKKNPNTMYLFASTYLCPNKEMDNYKNEVISLEKDLKLRTKDLLRGRDDINTEFLLVTELPVARISPERRVHFMIQFYFKPANSSSILNKTFNDISEEYSKSCSIICENFQDTIQKHDFKCFKTKS